MILVLLLYGMLASTFTMGKMLLGFLPPFFLISMRMIFSGGVLLIGYALFSKKDRSIRMQDLLILAFISLIHIFIPYSTEYIAMERIQPSCAALMYNLSPFFSAFFSYLYFSEKMTRTKWLGFTISIAGLIYFANPKLSFLAHPGEPIFLYVLLLFGVATSSLAWVLIRRFLKNKQYSILLINGTTMLLGGIESLLTSYMISEKVTFPTENYCLFALLFFAIVIVSNLFYNFYGYLLKRYTATFLAFMGVATPLIVAFYDWSFLGVHIDMHFFIALFLVSIGVYLFYKEELKQGYISQVA